MNTSLWEKCRKKNFMQKMCSSIVHGMIERILYCWNILNLWILINFYNVQNSLSSLVFCHIAHTLSTLEVESFNKKCWRRILNIKWYPITTDTSALEFSTSKIIESMIVLYQMRWVVRLFFACRTHDLQSVTFMVYSKLVNIDNTKMREVCQGKNYSLWYSSEWMRRHVPW